MSFYLRILLGFTLLYSTSATREYYVQPSTSCQELCLDDYARNASYYFDSNTIFTLMEGDHYLNSMLLLDSVANVTLRGTEAATATLTMSSNSSIVCTNSTDVVLNFLEISHRGGVGTTALLFDSTTFVEISDIQFIGSRSNVLEHSQTLKLVNGSSADVSSCSFEGWHGTKGGAIYVDQSIAYLSGTNFFVGNAADRNGGAIFANSSELFFSGMNTFERNFALAEITGGGAIFVNFTVININGTVHFEVNGVPKEPRNGVTMTMYDSSIRAEGNMTFRGSFGGGLTIFRSNFTAIGEVNFVDNFRNRRTFGAAIYSENSNLTFAGTTTFVNNIADVAGTGGALFMLQSSIHFLGPALFQSNMAEFGGALYLEKSYFYHQNDRLTYVRNTGIDKGGAIYASESTIRVSAGISNFTENEAERGGAIALQRDSVVVLEAPINMTFYRNKAVYGGGIFHSDLNAISQCQNITRINEACFFRVITANISDIQLNFVSNEAEEAGTILYGGALQLCRVQVNGNLVPNDTRDILRSVITNFSFKDGKLSSDALRVCFCENDTSNCLKRKSKLSVRRGQEFNLSLIAVGQFDFRVPSEIRAVMSENTITDSLDFDLVDNTTRCRKFSTRIFAPEGDNQKELFVFPDGPCGNIFNTRVVINVELQDCPPGFTFISSGRCTCEQRFTTLIDQEERVCDIDTALIRRPNSNAWIMPIWENETYMGFAYSSGCNDVYCKLENDEEPTMLNFSDPYTDLQCAENRTGRLCGRCKTNHSLTLMNFNCEPCENYFISLLLIFAVAGIALIVFLFLLQMTVAAGTINGLLLYANVINICRDVFFPPHDTNPYNPLVVFIAWINLDFGIPICFYDGLDYYVYCWLQFVFPLYLWFLIAIIILMNKYSTRVGKLFGSNPIAVLATVILMSYTKLLQTSVDALYFSKLEYPNGTVQYLWNPDPTISYFGLKHSILAVVSLAVLAFLILPFVFLLTFGFKLQKFSGKKHFYWFNNLKPLLDAYYAPFRKSSRYWIGLLLLIRAGLFLGLNVIPSDFTLTAVASLFAAVAIIPWLNKSIYEKTYLDCVEASFFLNISVLLIVSYYVQIAGKSQILVTNIFIGIAFIEFVGIVFYHACRRCFKRCKKVTLKKQSKSKQPVEVADDEMTTTVIELREPLLESL